MLTRLLVVALSFTFLFPICVFCGSPAEAAKTVDPSEVMKRKKIIHRALLNIYRSQKRKPDALKEFKIMVGLTPNDPRLRYEYGTYLAVHGNTKGGVAQLQKSLDLDPTNAEVAGALGNIFLRNKNYANACKYLKIACANGADKKYGKIYQDAYKYMQYQKRQAAYKKKQDEYRKKLKEQQARQKAMEEEDDDDDW